MKVEEIEKYEKWFVDSPSPLAKGKIVTIAILRTTTDYAAFRTEADKNINSVVTPVSMKNNELMERAVLLASKQKAVERRKAEQLLRELKDDYVCYVKERLCLSCPVCILNGGIGSIEKASGENISIRSRVLYQSAFSIESLEESLETITFNAVDEKKTEVGQALNERELIKPGTHFVSITSIVSPTLNELKFFLKYLLSTTRYGAETRGMGTIKNTLIGLTFADTEVTSALELLLESELSTKKEEVTKEQEIIKTLHNTFKTLSNLISTEAIFDLDTLTKIEKEIKATPLTKEFVEKLFSESKTMVEEIKSA